MEEETWKEPECGASLQSPACSRGWADPGAGLLSPLWVNPWKLFVAWALSRTPGPSCWGVSSMEGSTAPGGVSGRSLSWKVVGFLGTRWSLLKTLPHPHFSVRPPLPRERMGTCWTLEVGQVTPSPFLQPPPPPPHLHTRMVCSLGLLWLFKWRWRCSFHLGPLLWPGLLGTQGHWALGHFYGDGSQRRLSIPHSTWTEAPDWRRDQGPQQYELFPRILTIGSSPRSCFPNPPHSGILGSPAHPHSLPLDRPCRLPSPPYHTSCVSFSQ